MSRRKIVPGSLVKKLRTIMGLSQEAFAKRIGRSFASVRMYESGRMPPLDVLGRMLGIARTTNGAEAVARELEKILAPMLTVASELRVEKPIPDQDEEKQNSPEFRAGLYAMLDYV